MRMKGYQGLLFRRRERIRVGVLLLWEEERKSSLWWDCWVIFVEEQSYEEKKNFGGKYKYCVEQY